MEQTIISFDKLYGKCLQDNVMTKKNMNLLFSTTYFHEENDSFLKGYEYNFFM